MGTSKFYGTNLPNSSPVMGSSPFIKESDESEYSNSQPADFHKLDLRGVHNARQLGGYVTTDGRRVKDNLLIRTASLCNATPDDVEKLKRLNLKKTFDLRSNAEVTINPELQIDGVERCHVDVESGRIEMLYEKLATENIKTSPDPDESAFYNAESLNLQIFLDTFYLMQLISADCQKKYTELFRNMLDMKGQTILWHCTDGKDRTGITTVLMLSALGVDRPTCMKEFDVSNVYYSVPLNSALNYAKTKNADFDTLNSIQGIIGVLYDKMVEAWDTIDEQYGNMDNFLHKAIHLTDVDIQNLRDWYTE